MTKSQMNEIGSSDFVCSRVNSSTFVIHEKDTFDEHPFIYVKLYEDIPVVVISDTGCGGTTNKLLHSRNLRDFLETCPIASNHGQSLNPRDSNGNPLKEYMIICTHCHYDHILGLEQFRDASPEIVASLAGKSFIEDDLPEHSLCKSLDIPTPQYKITQWGPDFHSLSFDGEPLGIQILHTPGHTPDELAWYDESERHLYVGDSFYQRVAEDESYEQAILFPKEGNISDYLASLDKLITFVDAKNADETASRDSLKIGCGHVTSSVDAKEILLAVQKLFVNILKDKVPIVQREEKRGEEWVTWRENGEPRFSVAAPKRIMVDAKQSFLRKENLSMHR